jgi:ubiquinone biosynthesis protein COQ9
MIAPPERSPERDAALTALLPHVPFEGWTFRALRTGLKAAGTDPRDAEILFPAGAPDMIEAWCDLADRRMEQEAAALDMAELRTPARVRAVIALRLRQSRVNKEAVRRAVAALALPADARTASRCTARTVDAIWHAAGDRSADFSWYTKRAILTGVWAATLLFWLRDTSEDDAATLAFLDRRLADVGRITRLRHRIERTFRRPGASPAPETATKARPRSPRSAPAR